MVTRDLPLLNTLHLPVRWVDMDSYQHVNTSRYFDYMCEIHCMLVKDLPQQINEYQFVIVQTGCTFKKPYIYPDTIILKQYLQDVTLSTYTLFYEFLSEKDPSRIYAEGFTKKACFDPKTKTVIRLPQAFLERLGIR